VRELALGGRELAQPVRELPLVVRALARPVRRVRELPLAVRGLTLGVRELALVADEAVAGEGIAAAVVQATQALRQRRRREPVGRVPVAPRRPRLRVVVPADRVAVADSRAVVARPSRRAAAAVRTASGIAASRFLRARLIRSRGATTRTTWKRASSRACS
jgi:hypothetical protein